jgi:fructose-1,6-bisphosphatase/inositol monophosphatase family enzyme
VLADDDVLGLLHEAATAAADALARAGEWGPAGTRAGQYKSDLAADAAVRGVLDAAGVGVLSEESGSARLDADLVVVVDPLDGSTNASRRLPWHAVSLAAVDDAGPRAAVVLDLGTDSRYEGVRGGGARRDGRPLTPSACESLDQALVGVSGLPPRHLGWDQFRALGAIALDLCALAEGRLDGYVDCLDDAHGPWDYLGAALICREAGASVVDAFDRDLVALDHAARRTPVAAATPALLDALVDARRSFPAESAVP